METLYIVSPKLIGSSSKDHRLRKYLANHNDDIEKKLVDIFQDILQKDNISIHDNFFKLGGDSLFAMQMVKRLKQDYGFELQERVVFENPTVASLARSISKGGQEGQQLQNVSANSKGSIPLSFAQQRLWVLDQLIEKKSAYNMPIALRLKGTVNIAALECSYQKMGERH